MPRRPTHCAGAGSGCRAEEGNSREARVARGLIRVGREPASRRRAGRRSAAGRAQARLARHSMSSSPGDQPQPGAEARSARRLLSSSLGVRQRAKVCSARRRRRIGSRARPCRGRLAPHVRGRVCALGSRGTGVRTDLATLASPHPVRKVRACCAASAARQQGSVSQLSGRFRNAKQEQTIDVHEAECGSDSSECEHSKF